MEQDEAASSSPRPLKRMRADQDTGIGRRKSACQTCRLRKIKCDLKRPKCSLCQTSGNECVYLTEPPKQTLESVAEILTGRLDTVTKQLEDLKAAVEVNGARGQSHPGSIGAVTSPIIMIDPHDHQTAPEPSRDFSHIPPHRTTADTILTWPVFENKFTENFLIEPLLTDPAVSDPELYPRSGSNEDNYAMIASLAPLDEERIPSLVDYFLQNVHTKNPVIDVETLVQRSRLAATQGLGWDAWSCLVLLACALGSIAKPFGAWEKLPESEMYFRTPATQKELQQAENCFVLAGRRLGLLKQTMLAAQCHFFAGVYLMYTLRPMLSWQHFHQAAITYQLYLKTSARLVDNFTIVDHPAYQAPSTSMRKQSRLEQRMYWSCFKSETEFRVELPLPQSEIADYEFPQLFPSPPSPPSPIHANNMASSMLGPDDTDRMPFIGSPQALRDLSLGEPNSIRSHAKQLCREEESWYYYLTEVALRRIGNRIINTFFTSSRDAWLRIEPYLDIAVEFEAQVSSWYRRLPPQMKKYETNFSIRMPGRESANGAQVNPVSQELSWAIENRLLEMRSWLYQPFLYYLVHARPRRPSLQSIVNSPFAKNTTGSSPTSDEATQVLWNLIMRGIECNITILDTRSLPHRHHGLWYDLRAIMCASLILLAIVKSGYSDLIPGGVEALIEPTKDWTQPQMRGSRTHSANSSNGPHIGPVGGKFGKVIDQLRLWSTESPDMARHADVLESLILTNMVPG